MNDNYTKMCEKANLPWEQKVGDIIYGIGQQKDYIYVSKPVNTKAFPDSYYVIPPRGGCHLYRFPAGVIFKPSIEQLMEMVGWKYLTIYYRDNEWVITVPQREFPQSTETVSFCDAEVRVSLIQAVIHELHDKKWNGERRTP